MAPRTIVINPVTRVEGHGKVTVHMEDDGRVSEARFHILQFRGFEVFTRGRPYEEMPVITQRICGICPVSHQLASAKACDAILGREVPRTAVLLRELLHMGQYIQSHALHFFYLASPDLLLGWDADPAVRNVVGVIGGFREAAGKGIRLRRFGQEIIKALGGKRVHPAFSVAGGVTNPLPHRERDRLATGFAEAHATCRLGLDIIRDWVTANRGEVARFANFPSFHAGLVDGAGNLNLYDGRLRFVDAAGRPEAECDPADYRTLVGEQTEPWSYMKFPYLKSQGYPAGMYRVGPLARLQSASGIDTPLAAAELEHLRAFTADGLRGASLAYHYARLVELLYALEKAERLMADPDICGTEIKAYGPPLNREGVGMVEAPRGTLIHHYAVDPNGAMEWANLIVATGHNNLAMNRAVTLVAREYIQDGQVREGLLNRIEGAIRCYDPCLSCATHALGRMPLVVELVDRQGMVRDVLCRD